MKIHRIIVVVLVLIGLFGFKTPKTEKYLFTVELNDFSYDVIEDFQSDKILKIRFMPKIDILVPVINNEKLFYITQQKKNKCFWNKKSNVIIHLDWNYDSTTVVNKLRYRSLVKGTEYVESIDLSMCNNIESITFNVCYFNNRHPFDNLFKKHIYSPTRFCKYSFTVFLNINW